MKTVQVTGNFDNWAKGNAPLAKESGTFRDQIRVDKKQKLVFKFVVNETEWVTTGNYKSEFDENGIENNYIDADELIEVEEFEQEDVDENKGVSGSAFTGIGGSGKEEDVLGVFGDQDEDLVKEREEPSHSKDTGDALTVTSSFATISTNDSTSDSKYENIEDNPQYDREDVEDGARVGNEEEDDYTNANQFNTPTNSIFNSTDLYTPADRNNKDPILSTADTTISNVDSSSQRMSNASKQTLSQVNVSDEDKLTGRKDEIVEILKVPGSFPSPTSSETNSNLNYFENKQPVKRETFISKFKNLFKS